MARSTYYRGQILGKFVERPEEEPGYISGWVWISLLKAVRQDMALAENAPEFHL